MGFSASDVVPFTQARSHLSELADQAKAAAEAAKEEVKQ